MKNNIFILKFSALTALITLVLGVFFSSFSAELYFGFYRLSGMDYNFFNTVYSCVTSAVLLLVAIILCHLIFKIKFSILFMIGTCILYGLANGFVFTYLLNQFGYAVNTPFLNYIIKFGLSFCSAFGYLALAKPQPKVQPQPVSIPSQPYAPGIPQTMQGQQPYPPVSYPDATYQPQAPIPGAAQAPQYQQPYNPAPDPLSTAILNAIRPHLRAPMTAILCSKEEMTFLQNNGEYEIKGYVNSQNAYGAMIATDFTVKARYINNTWVITSTAIGVQNAKNFAKAFASNYIAITIFSIVMAGLLYFIISMLI